VKQVGKKEAKRKGKFAMPNKGITQGEKKKKKGEKKGNFFIFLLN
jgi:hypothetical protein